MTTLFRGDKEIVGMYKGTKEIAALYKGDKLIWMCKEPWVEYVDGVLTFHYDGNKKSCANVAYDLNIGQKTPSWYDNRTKITKIVFEENFSKARPATCYQWFYGMTYLTSIEGLDYLNTSKVTDMTSMFYGCSKLNMDLDLSKQDWSKVRVISSMFYNALLKSLKVPPMNGNSIVMSGVFQYIGISSRSLDLSMWKNLKIGGWLSYVFAGCNISNLKMFSGSGMEYLAGFFGSTPIEVIDKTILGGLNTSYAWYMGSLLSWNNATKVLDMSCLDTTRTESLGNLAVNCSKLISVTLPNFKDDCKLRELGGLFQNDTALEYVDFSVFNKQNTKKVTNISNLYNGCTSLKTADLSMLNTAKITSFRQLFNNCKVLTDVNLDTVDTTSVTSF